jgi:hypothetical protein
VVKVSFGEELLLHFFHECGNFPSQAGDFGNHLFVCFGKWDDMSCEGVTSLSVIILNICMESQNDHNKFFATGIRLLMGFRLEALFPACEGVTLSLEGW